MPKKNPISIKKILGENFSEHISQSFFRRFFTRSTQTGILPFDKATEAKKGQGFVYKNQEFVHHSGLPHKESAFFNLHYKQKIFLAAAWLFLLVGFLLNWHATLIFLFAALTILYFLDSLFNAFLIYRSFAASSEIKVSPLAIRKTQNWPTYTIFCPLYNEARVVPQFVKAMSEIDYPKDKLQILLLLEQDDISTIESIYAQNLPKYFQLVVAPHSQPRTKPKVMNYGLKFATGEYLVIYDAEDVPEPQQLKKAVLAFKKVPASTVCIQAKLNFYNPHQNILTRVFTAEYSLWFNLVLTGLQSIGAPIPLGGTSNHFKTEKLKELDGWDAFNVTEDADLGMRLARRGFSTAIMDSTTLEEANSDFRNWYRQRSRWIKGYMQTYLVHMRRPGHFFREKKLKNLLSLQLTIGGKILSMFINPLLWVITIIYFLFRSHVGLFIESFFPSVILYIGAASLVFGNFLYMYYYMIGSAKLGQYSLIKYVFLVPLYWLYMSVAAWQALYEMIVKPHYWAKTLHGLHLANAKLTDQPISESADQPTPFGALPNLTPALAMATPSANFNRSLHSAPFSTSEENVPSVGMEHEVEPNKFSKYFARIKTIFSSNIGSGSVLIAAMLGANFLNFLFNAVLGRALTLEDFATVTLFNTVLNILAVVLAALGGAITYKTAFLVGQSKQQASEKFTQVVKRAVWWASAALSLLWAVSIPLFSRFFHVNNFALVLSFTPVIMFGSIAAVQNGFLRGRFRFVQLGQAILYEALSKTLIAVLLVWAGKHQWASLAIPASIGVSFLVSYLFVNNLQKQDAKEFSSESPEQDPSLILNPKSEIYSEPFPSFYFGAALVSGLAGTIFLNVDVLLAKHYLNPASAGAYALLSLVGKMVFFFGTLLSPFVTSVVSKHEGAGTNPNKDFYRLVFGTAVISMGSCMFMALFGRQVVPFLFGSRSLAIVPNIAAYSFAMALFALSSTVISFHLVKKQYSFSFLMLAVSALLVLGIILNHSSINSFTRVMLGAGLTSFALIFGWHVLRKEFRFIARNLVDFLQVFTPSTPIYVKPGGKRILMFNWRDTKHAYAGGAEVYSHELAKRWSAEGNHVTLFCGNDGHKPRTEIVDGVHVVRRGGFYFVYVWAFVYYMLKFRGKFDVIVDCQNGIPFFTPLYVKEKVYCLMHHVHQEVFYRSLARPLAWFAAFLENTVMPIVYSRTKFITISDSSKNEMLELGLGRVGLEIVHPGVDLENLEPGKKYAEPLVVYLGRLKAYKSVDVLVRAFQQVAAKLPNAKLVIAGEGEDRGNIENLVDELGLEEKVAITGKITERQKITLLKSAWVFVNPSMMEGWGITTIEANACGVPVVAANVPGLRDSVQNPHTGYLVAHGDVDAFAEKILKILVDPDLQDFMGKNSVNWAAKFSWAKSARRAMRILYE